MISFGLVGRRARRRVYCLYRLPCLLWYAFNSFRSYFIIFYFFFVFYFTFLVTALRRREEIHKRL